MTTSIGFISYLLSPLVTRHMIRIVHHQRLPSRPLLFESVQEPSAAVLNTVVLSTEMHNYAPAFSGGAPLVYYHRARQRFKASATADCISIGGKADPGAR